MRTMLGELADTEAPAARIDLGRAISRGRRHRRWRRVAAGGSTLAVAAAAGAVVTLVAVPGPGTAVMPNAGATSSASPAHRTGVVAAPERFDPLTPYASFGWLPAGYTAGGFAVQPTSGTQSIHLSAEVESSPDAAMFLTVTVAGACTESGSRSLPVLHCRYDGSSSGPIRAASAAPPVNGQTAFWARDQAKSGMLIWEYAPGAWSVLTSPSMHSAPPPAGLRTVLARVAANVRYGDTAPIRFPYSISGIPAGWAASSTDFTGSSGQLLGQSLSLGPAADPGALGITVVPATPGGSCPFIAGQSQYVTVDGVRAVLRTLSDYQSLCATDIAGFQVSISLDTTVPNRGSPLPGVSGLGGAVGVAKALHLRGADPANWIAGPAT